MNDLLDHEELVELTGKSKPAAQIRALRRMNVPHLIRPDGRPVVRRTWLDEGASPPPARVTGERLRQPELHHGPEPCYDGLDGPKEKAR